MKHKHKTSLLGEKRSCKCPPDTELGKGLLVAGKKTNCPELLVGKTPSIPVMQKGEVALRDGSEECPIILPELQSRRAVKSYSLLEQMTDGTIGAIRGEDGKYHYASFAPDGSLCLIEGNLPEILSNLQTCTEDLKSRMTDVETRLAALEGADPVGTRYLRRTEAYLSEPVILFDQFIFQSEVGNDDVGNLSLNIASAGAVAPAGTIGVIVAMRSMINDYIDRVTYEGSLSTRSFATVRNSPTGQKAKSGIAWVAGSIPATWPGTPSTPDGEMYNDSTTVICEVPYTPNLAFQTFTEFAPSIHPLNDTRADFALYEILIHGWVVETLTPTV